MQLEASAVPLICIMLAQVPVQQQSAMQRALSSNLGASQLQPQPAQTPPTLTSASVSSSVPTSLPSQLSGGPSSTAAQSSTAKGLPMSVLLEVIQQHPNLKTRINEIVLRKDYTEAQKMAAIQQIV